LMFFPLFKSEDNTQHIDVFFPFTLAWRQHMNVFSHLLKSEDNTWMVFLFIYLSLKTTHDCFFPFT
jgi:hypothetical protein